MYVARDTWPMTLTMWTRSGQTANLWRIAQTPTSRVHPQKMLYRALSKFGDQFVYPVLPAFAKPIWDHPAGPKTLFFWAPLMKWGLVIAGSKDLKRPASKLSVYQNIALFITGGIWTRYSFVIIPVDYSLATVNFLVCSGLSQLCRIVHYKSIEVNHSLVRKGNYAVKVPRIDFLLTSAFEYECVVFLFSNRETAHIYFHKNTIQYNAS
ncbi:unnamed protein product [Angiostrongylus costaricensis]|uniref:Mitochondrial pyruvate carrier n=1 Tax=Angiostrongylus costaricensis TaxID=334426 RepID=A0A0R3PCR9_ANGCS|nr:unnamed protein product [Angiostrongylus costaricensis]